MNDNAKIDIRGSVNDAVEATAHDVIGLFVVVAILGCLIAPYWADLFDNYYILAYGVKQDTSRYVFVKRKMVQIKILLWMVAIFAWTLVIGVYIAKEQCLI